jgi:hypothetical protein
VVETALNQLAWRFGCPGKKIRERDIDFSMTCQAIQQYLHAYPQRIAFSMDESDENTKLLGSIPNNADPSRRRFNFFASHLLVFGIGLLLSFFLRQSTTNLPAVPILSESAHEGAFIFDDMLSKYTHFQGLGYEIYTGGAPAFDDDGVKNPECVGLGSYGKVGSYLQCYVGLKNGQEDVARRLQVMRDAVEKAYEVSDPSNTTLKLFVAPEFFFRGKNGAYNISLDYNDPNLRKCRHEVCQIFIGLESIVADRRFKDWLFVFGTVIASETLPDEHEFDFVFVNFAPVYKGYDPDTTTMLGKRLIVPKRYVSRIDFLTPRRKFNESTAKEIFDDEPHAPETTVLNPFEIGHQLYGNENWKRYIGALEGRNYAMVEFDFFIMDNITFSIEICLDHDRHVALNAFMANLVTGSTKLVPKGGMNDFTYERIPQHQAQISLVSSAGMTVNPESLVLANKGSIFLQDGTTNHGSFLLWDETCNVGRLVFDGGSEMVQRSAVLNEKEIYFEYELKAVKKKEAVYSSEEAWKKALKGVFTTMMYKPMINVYDPMPIPEV